MIAHDAVLIGAASVAARILLGEAGRTVMKRAFMGTGAGMGGGCHGCARFSHRAARDDAGKLGKYEHRHQPGSQSPKFTQSCHSIAIRSSACASIEAPILAKLRSGVNATAAAAQGAGIDGLQSASFIAPFTCCVPLPKALIQRKALAMLSGQGLGGVVRGAAQKSGSCHREFD
ncbi:MAG TPA: hypothetical protein VNK48_04035 [Xanthobacteraceae bacterium]|nr:hypothetical protein [Xanthobacteraceae bacterium]